MMEYDANLYRKTWLPDILLIHMGIIADEV